MLQLQSGTSSFHNDNQIQLMNEIVCSDTMLNGKASAKNSNSDFSQTMANYQPSISDQVKVGFFSCDRFAQTEESDILALNDAINNLIYLNKEMSDVKYDLKFAKNSTQNRFETELRDKSIEMYGIINKKISEIKLEQEENLKRIRRAYNTKLANAVIKISASFEDEYNNKKAMSAENRTNLTQTYILKIKELERSVAELEFGVSEAKKIAQENLEKMDVEHQIAIEKLNQEKQKIMDDVETLTKKNEKLEENSSLKDEEIDNLQSDITTLEADKETLKSINEELTQEFENYKKSSEMEKKKIKLDYEKQRVALETKMHEKLKESREQIVNAAKQELQQQKANQEQDKQRILDEQKAMLADQEKEQQRLAQEQEEKQRRMMEKQKELLEQQQMEKEVTIEKMNREKTLQEEKLKQSMQEKEQQIAMAAQQEREKEQLLKSAKNSRPEDIDLIIKLKANEQYLKSDVARLSREINRTNETWEKKFDILKHSLHAIKDEMYLRQNLQKSSVNLAYASIAYTMDQPPSYRGNTSTRTDGAQKPILPSIGKNDRTLSVAPSMQSRNSVQFEKDENQVIGDDEMKEFKEEFMNGIDFIQVRP